MATERRPNFNFLEMGISIGDELVLVSNTDVKVTVKDNRKVLYQGKEYYLTDLDNELGLKGNPCGHWYYKGKRLDDLYNEIYGQSTLIAQEILQTINDEINSKYSKQFYVPEPYDGNSNYLWIGDKEHLIGDHSYHYEIEIDQSRDCAFGHDGKHAFVELHIGEKKTATIARYFGDTIKKLEQNKLIDGFEWQPRIHSLRLETGKSGHLLSEKNLIKNLLKELSELDSIIGSTLREKISLYERSDRIKDLINKYKRLLKKNNNTDFIDDELFKWEYITKCKDLTPVETVKYLIKTNSILADSVRVYSGWKDIIKDNSSGFEKVLYSLLDETKNLDERLISFESDMESLFKPYPKYKVFANDERTASCLLGCKYPDKYTFFKYEKLYDSLCFHLGVDEKSKRNRYKHFLELLNEIVPYVKSDVELQEIISTKTKGLLQSDLLTTQNVCYCVFEDRAKKILGESTMTNKSTKLIEYTNLLRNKKNIILQGAPGTGKTYNTAEIALSLLNKEFDNETLMEVYNELTIEIENGKITKGQIGFVTFHQSMDYEDFVEGLKPETSNGNVVYNIQDGIFKAISNKAKSDADNNYVLIIDEINRGNVSKIFGELITLLEGDKRIGGDHHLNLTLPYSKEKFEVPSNLYIIGTMNTTDRSVGNIDYAVRRRFSFVTLESDREFVLLKNNNDENSKAVRLFDAVKNFLEENKCDMDIDDLMVGHSYFATDTDEDLEIKWKFDILPLLREYFKDGIVKKSLVKNMTIEEFIEPKE